MSDLIGKMRDVCVLKSNATTDLGAGGLDNYVALLTTRGYLKKASGGRGVSFGDIAIGNTHTLIVRKSSQMTGSLRRDSKWEIKGRTFTINDYEEMEDPHYYKFSLTEQRT